MNFHRTRLFLVAAGIGLVLAGALPAAAGEPEPPPRGVVDASFLDRFVPRDDDGTFVEVSLTGPLLELAAQVLEGQDPELAGMVRGLRSVTTRVIELPDDPDRAAQATRALREVADRLRKKGWQPLARVRDGGDEVHVLLLPGGKTVDGLTVMVRSSDGELVFANIAGKIDLARLGEVLRNLDVPGMDEALSALPRGDAAGKGGAGPGGKDAPAGGDREGKR